MGESNEGGEACKVLPRPSPNPFPYPTNTWLTHLILFTILFHTHLFGTSDLVPREVGEKWLKYFREELPTVAFKCSTQQQAEKLGRRKMPGSSSNRVVEDGSGLQVGG